MGSLTGLARNVPKKTQLNTDGSGSLVVVLSGPEGVYQCRFFAQNGKVKDLRSQERPQTRPSNTNNLHVSFSWSLLFAVSVSIAGI